jgi:hypothetical protein
MVSKKTLKDYEFKTIEIYFDYIVESYINGQLMQVCNLCKDLSKKQKLHCLNYLQNNYGSIEAILYINTKLI